MKGSVEDEVSSAPSDNEAFEVGYVGDMSTRVIDGAENDVDMLKPDDYPPPPFLQEEMEGCESKVTAKAKAKQEGKETGTQPVADAVGDHMHAEEEQVRGGDRTAGDDHPDGIDDNIGSDEEEGDRPEGGTSNDGAFGASGRKGAKGELKGKGRVDEFGEDKQAKGNSTHSAGKRARHPRNGGLLNIKPRDQDDYQAGPSNPSGGPVTQSLTPYYSISVDTQVQGIISGACLSLPLYGGDENY
jgi:hypothetical protein